MDGYAMATSPGRLSARYTPPAAFEDITLDDALHFSGRFTAADMRRTLDLFAGRAVQSKVNLHYCGRLDILKRKCVAIVGTRQLSDDGVRRTRKLAALVAKAGGVVVSGLALGADTEAHTAALANGGETAAVIGTPLDRCNPPRNAPLQEVIYSQHLLLSQFEWGSTVYPTNFPKRNKVMAALTDATIIVEASDTSGTLHQAAECVRLGRPLFILKSVTETPNLAWPAKFIGKPSVHVLAEFDDVISIIGL